MCLNGSVRSRYGVAGADSYIFNLSAILVEEANGVVAILASAATAGRGGAAVGRFRLL